MPKAYSTFLEIDLGALESNFHTLSARILPKTKFMAVVKAYAYGSDATRIAKKLESLGIDYFAVAYVKEGVALREAGIKTPILVLHPQAVNFSQLIDRCLEPSLYSFTTLKEFLKIADKKKQKEYPVHLKFNTGLNRLGFQEEDLPLISEQLADRSEIKIISIFSHLAASEDLKEKAFSTAQIAAYKRISKTFEDSFGYLPMQHILNTSGIINYPEAQFNMVRSGIGLYGFGNLPLLKIPLEPVATLKTIISQIHHIKPKDSVGYNRAFSSTSNLMTATLPIGHADGIGRHYGNGKAWVIVNGKKAPIIGNVCMDMMMIDVSGIECSTGDEVIIFGKKHTAEMFASSANTISYELLTGISQRVERVFIKK